MTTRFFPLEEYEARWARVDALMAERGYDTAVVWSRSAGTYDRCADALYLVNYYGNHSGQSTRASHGFAAVILRRGEEPELVSDELDPRLELVATGNARGHPDTVAAVAKALQGNRGGGRVALVGTDFFPMKHWAQLAAGTSHVDWVHDDALVREARLVKSPRELEAFRRGGEIVTEALTALIERLIAGRPESEAAGEAARIVFKGGGHPHMIPMSHGDEIDHFASDPLPAFNHEAPKPGDMVRGWVYGPMFQGYWLDPGRTSVCGKPSAAQKELVEANAAIVEALIAAVRPGVTVAEVCAVGDKASAAFGGDKSEMAEKWPIYGHGNGLFLEAPSISTKVPGFADFVLEESMVVGLEAFFSRAGVGSAGFEQNVIVTADGAELLTRTPMLFW